MQPAITFHTSQPPPPALHTEILQKLAPDYKNQCCIQDIPNFGELCKYIAEWDIQILIENAGLADLLVWIGGIRFRGLTKLDLRFNNIVNVEPITRIDMPQLQMLYLDDNLLSCVSPLHKLPSPLKSLTLSNNFINELTFLSQCNFKLTELALEYVPDPYMVMSVGFMGKLPDSWMDGGTIRILAHRRMREKQVCGVLGRKFPTVDLRKKK